MIMQKKQVVNPKEIRDIPYVLITSAKNEENFIRLTIESVVLQSILPVKWIIVSDNSTDGTDDIIREYSSKFSFIKYVRTNDKSKRDFASKTFALKTGYEHLKNIDYDFIGILDADVTFEPNYYQTIFNRFLLDEKLGIAGGVFYDFDNGEFQKITPSYHSVRGAVQLFRRKCYEDIGEWVPLEFGGEDSYAEISARQHGWKVRTFDDAEILHHRRTGSASSNFMKYKFREGKVEYSLGYHPLFQIIKCVGRLNEKPYIIGTILRFVGFWWMTLKREKRSIPKDFFEYIRKEQKERIKSLFSFNKKRMTL